MSGIKAQGILRDFLQTFDDESVALLLTDPPYETDLDDIDAFAREWVRLALSKVSSSGRSYIFTGAYPNELRAYINAITSQQRTLRYLDVSAKVKSLSEKECRFESMSVR